MTACISAAVILAIFIGVAVDSQNIFKASKVNQIHNGMTKDEVVKILGETEFASDYSWNYYSSNFVKLMREAEDLSKQMANAQDFEQVLKIQQQIDELQKKMQNSTYKYITVTFDIEGKVTDVKYDFNYNPIKNAETQSSLGIKINYNLFSA